MKQLLILLFLILTLSGYSQTIEYDSIFISDSKINSDSTMNYLYINYYLNKELKCHVDIFKILGFIIEDVYLNNDKIEYSYSIKNLNGLKYLKEYEFIFISN